MSLNYLMLFPHDKQSVSYMLINVSQQKLRHLNIFHMLGSNVSLDLLNSAAGAWLFVDVMDFLRKSFCRQKMLVPNACIFKLDESAQINEHLMLVLFVCILISTVDELMSKSHLQRSYLPLSPTQSSQSAVPNQSSQCPPTSPPPCSSSSSSMSSSSSSSSLLGLETVQPQPPPPPPPQQQQQQGMMGGPECLHGE